MKTNNMKIVFLFSGQGSQYRRMGQKLYENNRVFKASLEESEVIVGKYLQRSLIRELYATTGEFDDLLITHPAIVAIEIAMYQVLKGMGIKADYVFGISLGEFAAGVVSGIWNTKAAVEASIEQSKSISRRGTEGGMIAVMHERRAIEHLYLGHDLFLAADNFEGHFTLAGSIESLDTFQKKLRKFDIQFLRLPVQVPFHSPLILDSLGDFNYYMASSYSPSTPNPGFVSGLKCKELSVLPANYFGKVVSLYTDFPKLVRYTENKGPCFYIDLGPSGTSATFVKYNLEPLSLSETFQIMTPYGRELEQLKKLKKILGL